MVKRMTVIYSLLTLLIILVGGGLLYFKIQTGQSEQPVVSQPMANINQPGDNLIAVNDCVKFNGEYKGKGELKKINKNNQYNLDEYKLFNNDKYKFYYPKNWTISKDNETIIFRLPGTARVYLDINQPKVKVGYIMDYNSCINRCFLNVSSEDDVEISNFAAFCSVNNSKDNLEKIISGNYVEYLQSGSLPPGGTSNFIITKFIDDNLITISIGSDDLQFLPIRQSLYSEKRYNQFTDDDKDKLNKELNDLIDDLFIIIESFTFNYPIFPIY